MLIKHGELLSASLDFLPFDVGLDKGYPVAIENDHWVNETLEMAVATGYNTAFYQGRDT
jgi:hypothetical protein